MGNGRFRLLKFVVNNAAGRRIFALIWSTLIEQYEKEISLNRVIRIRGALVKRATPNYFQEEQHFVAFEINIQNYTEVEFFQVFGTAELPVAAPIQEVNFDNIAQFANQVISKSLVF